MTKIVAIETATEACSVALVDDGEIVERVECVPRQHSQLLFTLLKEVLPQGNLREQGVDAIAYGSGPGSFTGLRIAASAVQGLAYANTLPAISISTLECLAQAALRQGLASDGDTVLALLDARIRELYWGCYRIVDGLAECTGGPAVCVPGELPAPSSDTRVAVGDGCKLLEQPGIAGILQMHGDLQPTARDLIPRALQKWDSGELQRAHQVAPVYIRDEINWKKVAQQGKPT